MSGRTNQSGGVEAVQSPSPAGGVSTVSSSVEVLGSYRGSVPQPGIPSGPISLSLSDAVKRGLATNLGPISASNSVKAARAQRAAALGALLPNIAVNASETVTQIDLAAYGFQFKAPPNSGFTIPTVVGPFAYSQAQATLSQSILNFVQRRNCDATKQTEKTDVAFASDAREVVVLAVVGSYLQTLTAEARVTSQLAQEQNAQAVYNQAVVRKQAGTNARIDVTRSLVELQTQQQRLSSFEAGVRKQKIALARLIGLPLDREITLTDALASVEAAALDPAVIVQRAFAHRSDLKAAEAQVHAAEAALAAAHAERLPTISLNGNYGVIGPNPATTHGVFAVTGSLNVPIYEGGRIKSDIQGAEATLHQRQSELADQRGAIEQQVRTALIDFETASGQVRLARSNRDYAQETLKEARDRFTAGVATTVEVIQAQEQVAGAENDYISSLFSLNLAQITVARASGDAESSLPNLLERTRP
jgi:outer membrane protein TolC